MQQIIFDTITLPSRIECQMMELKAGHIFKASTSSIGDSAKFILELIAASCLFDGLRYSTEAISDLSAADGLAIMNAFNVQLEELNIFK